MTWEEALKAGFDDELKKISEVNLSGLSSEALLEYPQRQSMPSAAYEKAQAILAKVQRPEEKTAAFSPDPGRMPQASRLFGRKRRREGDPPPGKMEKLKSIGGHAIAGAGTAKFVGDFAEQALASRKTVPPFMMKKYYEGRFPPAVKAAIMAGGAGLGLAERARKERRKKKWQQGKIAVASAGSPFKFPSTGRASAQFLGKGGPSIKQQSTLHGLRGRLP